MNARVPEKSPEEALDSSLKRLEAEPASGWSQQHPAIGTGVREFPQAGRGIWRSPRPGADQHSEL